MRCCLRYLVVRDIVIIVGLLMVVRAFAPFLLGGTNVIVIVLFVCALVVALIVVLFVSAEHGYHSLL